MDERDALVSEPLRRQSRTGLPFLVGIRLAREAPSVRIGLFGVHDIEGMGEPFVLFVILWRIFLPRTIISTINSCIHPVEGEY